MNCELIRAQLEAYALGALDDDERRSVEAHLETCSTCRQIAQEHALIAHTLPQAVAASSPLRLPTHLKARILQAIETAPESASTPTHARLQTPPHSHTQSWWSWLRPRNVAFATLLVALLAALLWGWQLNVALAQERQERALLFQQQELVLEVIDSTKKLTALMRPPPGSNSNSYGKVHIHPDLRHVVVMGGRLPPPPVGQAYHVWLTLNGQQQLIGTMPVNDDGFGILVFDADRNGPMYEAAQLTLQPLGSTTPSSSSVVQWRTSR